MTVIKSNDLGKLLIMPPHDVVQGGEAHPVGKGSGKQLQDSIERELKLASSYDVVVYEANDRFNFIKSAKTEDIIVEAKKMDADYCLILSLGEFLNAAPFTARRDFVTLDSGVLFDVNSKKVVWKLHTWITLSSNSLGNHYGLIDDIAEEVAKSIIRSSQI